MGIADDESRLFARWNDPPRPSFQLDGVLDEERFDRSRTKLLFLLKEPNAPDHPNGDLRWWLRRHGDAGWLHDVRGSRTFPNLARWAAAVRLMEDAPSRAPTWEEYGHPVSPSLRRELWSTACVNLKKAVGGGATNGTDLWNHAGRDATMLAEQLALYPLDVVILCGPAVTAVAKAHLTSFQGRAWKTTTSGVQWTRTVRGALALAWHHPAARRPNRDLAEPLVDAIHDLRYASGWASAG